MNWMRGLKAVAAYLATLLVVCVGGTALLVLLSWAYALAGGTGIVVACLGFGALVVFILNALWLD